MMAHHDSKSQRIPLTARVIVSTCALLWLIFFCFILFMQILLRSFAAESLTALGWATLLAAALLVFGALLFDEGNRSPGAMDNGTGVAVLLGLARRLAQNPPSSNVWLVATGAEEEGLQGSIHFARKYASGLPRERTLVLNLDMVGGSGAILILDRQGIPPKGTGQALARELERLCRDKGIGCSRIWLALGAGADHLPFGVRGYESVTISRGKLLTDFRTIHSTRDTWERVDEKSMEE
ncbi:MAG: M28 family peptidase, partial [Armatimonadetes bacterium]|nr:M28 family peptidase [Armatimonadota bacterium]